MMLLGYHSSNLSLIALKTMRFLLLTDQNGGPLEREDKVNLILLIIK